MAAKPKRRSRDYTPEEIEWLTDPSPPEPIDLTLRMPEGKALVVTAPPLPIPRWVRGEGLEEYTRGPEFGDVVGPPVQSARRLTVTADGVRHSFVFDPEHGGSVTVFGDGRGPDPLDWQVGCLGRFSPWSRSITLREELHGRFLVALERTASETVERVVPLDPLSPPMLIVEVVRPDEREPWIIRTDSASFRLDAVTSITLEDVV
jgi:hypothetical protein